MIYDGTIEIEAMMAHPEDNPDAVYSVKMRKSAEENIFYVYSDYDEDFEYAFWLDGTTNYEVVKFTIMDTLISFASWDEALQVLENDFMTSLRQILVQCDGDCENCNLCEGE